MKKTRNLFVLIGNQSDITTVLPHLDFKGLKTINKKHIINKDIEDIFINNKSAICAHLPPKEYASSAIYIDVLSKNNDFHINSNYISVDGDISDQFEYIADKYNCDIGDHKSKTSGLDGIPTIEDCYYCNYLKRTLSQKNERTLYRSPNFFVIPTIGQFIPGYLLIIPNQHVMSNAELTSAIISEFSDVLDDILFILKLTYGKYHYLVWENGTGNSGKGKAIDSIVHAHIHVAPSNLTVPLIESSSGFPFEHVDLETLSKYKNNSYLLIRDEYRKLWKICNNPNIYIPRQYIRQVLADENNIDGELWNWRNYPFNDQMMKTCADISKALRDNWYSLPERIRLYTRHYVFDF